jgi:hypothetical protein
MLPCADTKISKSFLLLFFKKEAFLPALPEADDIKSRAG